MRAKDEVVGSAKGISIAVAPIMPVNVDAMYVMAPVHELPPVNTLSTVGTVILSRRLNNKAVEWSDHHYWWMAVVLHLSLLVVIGSWIVSVSTSRAEWLAMSGLVLGTPCLLMSTLQLNTQILSLLVRQYEFCVGTFLNVSLLMLLGLILRNARAAAAVLMCAMTQLLLVLDASFKTVQVDIHLSWLWLPAIVGIGVLCVDAARTGSVATMWLTMLFNVAVTLFILVTKRTYQRRVLLWRLWSVDTVIPCSSRASLKLVQFPAAIQTQPSGPTHLKVALPDTGIPIRARCKLVPACSPNTMVTSGWLIFLYANGIIGFTVAPVSLFMVIVFDFRDAMVLWPMAIVSFCTSSVFCITFALNFQRQLLTSLLQSFDLWFTSLQFSAASVCLADLLQWDYRCLNIISWYLFAHFVLLVDALSPSVRQCFRFRKIYVFPIPAAILIGTVVISYMLLAPKHPVLQSRTIRLGTAGGFTFVIQTATFMTYRVFTIFPWILRVACNLWYTDEQQLVLLRGTYWFSNSLLIASRSQRHVITFSSRWSFARRKSTSSLVTPVAPTQAAIAPRGLHSIDSNAALGPSGHRPDTSQPQTRYDGHTQVVPITDRPLADEHNQTRPGQTMSLDDPTNQSNNHADEEYRRVAC